MMKKVSKIASMIVLVASTMLISCKKDECHECHYENAKNEEVELGVKCNEELEDLEASGITVDGVKYEVHCHGH